MGKMKGKGAIIGKGRASEVFTWWNDQVLKLYRDSGAGAETEREFHTTATVH